MTQHDVFKTDYTTLNFLKVIFFKFCFCPFLDNLSKISRSKSILIILIIILPEEFSQSIWKLFGIKHDISPENLRRISVCKIYQMMIWAQNFTWDCKSYFSNFEFSLTKGSQFLWLPSVAEYTHLYLLYLDIMKNTLNAGCETAFPFL